MQLYCGVCKTLFNESEHWTQMLIPPGCTWHWEHRGSFVQEDCTHEPPAFKLYPEAQTQVKRPALSFPGTKFKVALQKVQVKEFPVHWVHWGLHGLHTELLLTSIVEKNPFEHEHRLFASKLRLVFGRQEVQVVGEAHVLQLEEHAKQFGDPLS